MHIITGLLLIIFINTSLFIAIVAVIRFVDKYQEAKKKRK